jgi:hypothetical protein
MLDEPEPSLRRTMKVARPNYTGNIIPFKMRSERDRDPVDEARQDNVLGMLDLSKFDQPRPDVETDPSMRANIVAMVLLGLLVFLAAENFSRLERSNLCIVGSQCF